MTAAAGAADAAFRALARDAANDADQVRRLVGALAPRFSALTADVSAVVGGSTQRVDVQMVSTMSAAEEELRRAESLLAATATRLRAVAR